MTTTKKNFSFVRDINKEMPAKYDPKYVEDGIYDWWNSQGYFKASEAKNGGDGKKMTMIIPPPNVTGRLHIGHALMCTIEDCIVRWSRMRGRATVWVPGVDHAGIATQNVVERQLFKTKGLKRFDLGREKFEAEVWNWKKEYGSRIVGQIKRLGATVDWSREFFTLDENLSKAVTAAFVRLHKQKKIYRAKRFVNWSCALTTAIADCEVDKIEVPKRALLTVPGYDRKVEFGVIHKFSYKFVDSGEEIFIETTRPETMLGDVALAVHPDDKRYQKYIGKFVQHPFVDRKMQIIADKTLVDMEKGTGVVKITPAHDENDYNCGQRHGLKGIVIFDENGNMNEHGGLYRGMKRFTCRYKVISDLEQLSQYYGKRDFAMVVPTCSRSGDVIEPMNTSQWVLDCEEAAARSLKAVRENELEIMPKREEKTFFNFLENIRPWCLSRQLWWGHRIPAYLPVVDGMILDREKIENWIVSETREEAMEVAKGKFGDSLSDLKQDEDVLDTWFSSALLPFSVFGWPEETEGMEKFFPNTILETGSDILFFWVARMVFLSLLIKDVLPFKKILLHPMVRASDGSKMSKSKGNVIDPLEVIDGISLEELLEKLKGSNLSEKEINKHSKTKKKEFPNGIPSCGSDALRFGLLCYLNQSGSINLDINRVVGYRMFCNKIWQAANYVYPKLRESGTTGKIESLKLERDLSLPNKWILGRLNHAIATANDSLEIYDLAAASNCIYDFFLNDFCDVYIELTKPVFYSKDAEKEKKDVCRVLYAVFENYLKLLQPFMPFISEELFQRLPGQTSGKAAMVSDYPVEVEGLDFAESEADMKTVLKITKGLRSAKMFYGIGNAKIPVAYINSKIAGEKMKELTGAIATLARVEKFEMVDKSDEKQKKTIEETCSKDVVDSDTLIHLNLSGVTEINLQVKRLQKRSSALQSALEALRKKLGNAKRNEKIPKEILEADRLKEKSKSEELEKLTLSLEHLDKFVSK